MTKVLEPNRVRRGEAYATLKDNPQLLEAVLSKQITQRQLAAEIGVTEGQVSENLATLLSDRAYQQMAEGWEQSPEVREMLGLFDEMPRVESDELEDWLDRAVAGFVTFRGRFFHTTRGPYLTKPFHRMWIRSILRAIALGDRQLILSPPRHGKSELLVHFCVWMICRDPNFRIVWIGGNADISGDMVSAVRIYLEDNEELRKEVLPPGVSWAPQGRRNTTWGGTKFTVANRTVVSKAPTLRAIGRAGKILSMDVDLLICDDLEDFDSTVNESTRGQTRHWFFNSVESRKEEHTAWVVIGSRQHPDDLNEYLLGDDEWNTIVDSAHSLDCDAEEGVVDAHIDCMLFPELRSYRWLLSKKRSAEAQGLLSNFEMVYLNDPRPAGLVVFSEEDIEMAKNHTRGIGLAGLDREKGWHLVAGLDPSATGFQAGFLWAWVKDENRLYVVDMHNRKGGGVYPALELMQEWYETYGVKHWVIEENGFQKAIRENRDVRDWASNAGVYLEGHQTQGPNKHDPLYGVGAMANLYAQRMVDLPYGDESARAKMNIYIRQMLRFVDSGTGRLTRSKRLSDVLMASWFPTKAIRRFQKEAQARMSTAHDPAFSGFEASEWNEVPW